VDESDALWALLRGGGQVIMLRHAATDGTFGDPPGFQLGACATQRNLTAQGREQARRSRCGSGRGSTRSSRS
jgi:hypothetical protein